MTLTNKLWTKVSTRGRNVADRGQTWCAAVAGAARRAAADRWAAWAAAAQPALSAGVACAGAEPLEGRLLFAAARATDINLSSNSSSPTSFTNVGGTAYFVATSDGSSNGNTLWRSDGTAAGTALVKGDFPNSSGPLNLTSFGGALYFQSGASLYRSDGTAAGTVPVKTFVSMYNGASFAGNLLSAGGSLYFTASDNGAGAAAELWMSDGTAAGTVLVKDINPSSGSSSPQQLTAVGGTVFFTADDGTNGRELWESDGTAAGTTLVKDVRPGATGSAPTNLTNVGGTLYFSADDGVSGAELWRSDGTTAGTSLVADLTPGATGTAPAQLTAAAGGLFFTSANSTLTSLLWRSDGTAAGTVPLKTIPAAAGLTPFAGAVYFTSGGTNEPGLWRSDGTVAGTAKVAAATGAANLAAVGGALYFSASTPAASTEPWKSDGTAAGTAMLADLYPSTGGSFPRAFAAVGGKIFFAASDGYHGSEPWVTDGTAAGSAMLRDINATGSGTRPQSLVRFRGQAYFVALSGNIAGLFRTDGTPAGTSLVFQTAAPSSFASANPLSSLVVAGNTLYFQMAMPSGGPKLYATDGTPAGTRQIRQFAGIDETAAMNGVLYLTAFDASTGWELYRSDGTVAGTNLVKDIWPADSSKPRGLTTVGNTLFFWANTGASGTGYELYKTDGTAAGTVLVKDINPNGSSAFGDTYQNTATAVLDGILYFAANDGVHGRELWRSDGTAAGTYLVKDLQPGSDEGITITNDEIRRRGALAAVTQGPAKGIYFFGDSASGYALYKSDGTAAGTGLLKALSPSDAMRPFNLTGVGGQLFFTDPDEVGTDYYRVYRSDGTAAGTVLVHAFETDNISSDPGTGYMLDVGGVAYFTGRDLAEGGGNELWRSDGTVAGTSRVTDIAPGSASAVTGYYASDPAYAPVALGGYVILPANDGVYGLQLWRYGPDVAFPVPAATSGLSATVVNGVRVNLAWQDNSSDEIGFRVERSTSPTFATVTPVAYLIGNSTSYADAGLTENTTYYYRVVAYNSGGDAAAPVASATTPNTPTSPTFLTASAAGGTDSGRRVDLAWTDNAANETGFRLERSFSADFASVDQSWVLPAGATGFADTTVAPLARHYYRLVAFNAAGDSAVPAKTSILTPDVLPTGPTGLLAWGISDTAVQLQWTDNAVNEQSFLVERSDAGGPFQQIAEVATGRPAYTDGTVLAGVSYAYRVRAKGSAGTSDYTATATAAPLPPQLTGLVADINGVPMKLGSNALQPVVSGGVAYFQATGTTGGAELWRTDGTAAGTYRVIDLNVGSGSSSPTGLTDVNGTLYFFASDGGGRAGLWKTDGTAAGTAFVAPGLLPANTKPVVTADGSLYFTRNTAANGTELWKSDGTGAGTGIVRDLVAGTIGSSPDNLTAVGDTLYFTATTAGLGTELYKSDGTAAGTVLIKDVFPGTTTAPSQLVAVGSRLLFQGNDGTTGAELWTSDGTTAGTAPVTDLNPGSAGSNPRYGAVAGGTLFYAADGPSGLGLYRSDGTAAGTALVKALPASVDQTWRTTVIGGTAYFFLTPTGGGGQTYLYKSDGTDAGTVQVAPVAPGVANALVSDAVSAGGALFFVTARATGGRDLWRSDGTAAGTVALTAGVAAAGPAASPAFLTAYGSTVLFRGTDEVGIEPWRSDGTAAGTGRLKDLAPQTGDSNPALLTRVGTTTYFAAKDGTGTAGLYRTDGTGAGTARVAAVGTVTAVAAAPGGGNAAVFATFDGGVAKLWLTDGSVGSVVQLSASLPTAAAVDALYAAGSAVFFRTRNGDGSYQLWKTDGTAAGTARVGDVNPVGANAAGKATAPVVAGGVLYFAASSPTSTTGVELWRSDGTAAGTTLVKDVSAGAADGGPFALTAVGTRVFFVATDPTRGWALWKTDGTAASTVVVRDGFTDGTANPALGNLAAVGGTLYFSAADPNYGLAELWKSDGTTAGTALAADVNPGFDASSPSGVTDVNGAAYFFATDADRGPGLWRTDGTAAGTVRVKDVTAPGTYSLYILNANGTAYFADGGYLWKTDGTTTGTVRQMAIGTAGSPAAAGATAAFVDDRVVFAAADPESGRELWQLSVAPPAAPSAAAAASAAAGGARVTWQDNAANETGFEVDRLVPVAGGGTAVGATYFVPADATQLLDPAAPAVAGVQYRVRAYNAAGASAGTTASVTTAATVAPTIVSWASAAAHGRGVGEVALAIPDDGSFVEPRLAPATTLLVTFDQPIAPASLTAAGVGAWGVAADGSPVNLSGLAVTPTTRAGGTVAVLSFGGALPDYARYLVRLSGVTGTTGLPLAGDNDRLFTVLLGDVTGDRRTNSTDVGGVTSLRGVDPVNPADLNQVRSDVTLDGRVNSTDVGGVTSVRGKDARFIPDPVPTGLSAAPQAAISAATWPSAATTRAEDAPSLASQLLSPDASGTEVAHSSSERSI